MYSRNHAAVSAALAVVVLLVAPPPTHPLVLFAVVLGVGVGVDVDHFLVARLNTGSWKNLRRVVRDPSLVLVGQREIFDAGDLWRDQRLLSHALLGGAAVAGLWPVSPYWAAVVGATLYVHVVSDLAADAASRDRYLERAAAARGSDP